MFVGHEVESPSQMSISQCQSKLKKKKNSARSQWLMLTNLAAWETEIVRIVVQGKPGQTILETPISKITRANGLEVWLTW
jgi:hypothetical protein